MRYSQRFVCDVLRQRGQGALPAQKQMNDNRTCPGFDLEIILECAKLSAPGQFFCFPTLEPFAGVGIDPLKRPFVLFRSPRRPSLESAVLRPTAIWRAKEGRHTCCFVGFTLDPLPTRHRRRLCNAQGISGRRLLPVTPKQGGKRCIIGNCQAGLAVE